MMKADIAVLGAGIVGVAAALQLQTRGREVVLIDRRGVGEETSFGNAGIIERASIFPYLFPRDIKKLAVYAFNGLNEARYHWRDAPAFAPFLFRYFLESAPRRALDHALSVRPLIEACLDEHETLMAQAGVDHLLRKTGWIKLFRDEASFSQGRSAAEALKPFGLRADLLDAQALKRLEPSLREGFGAVHYLEPASVSDPLALTLGYLKLFEARGGRFVRGDATTLRTANEGFGVATVEGPLLAREVVLSLGPWSDLVLAPLGYKLPFAVKRGYHRHFHPQEGASLSRPVLDADRGYLLAPMAQGIRVTTGAEFARRDAPPDYTQVEQSEIFARELFPLAERIEEKPWMGSRPCLPDMLPVLGPAPRHKGLWFNFGHQHHGLTLAAVCGRLLAEMMTGEQTFADPSPFSIERF
ncbi:D-amino-acid dehydrogenase [Rhodoblastus acidophilus]|uniref:NAD(P)/FAD-dependent oxidoreductase n=1 Tax=Rhodoblastus acidophilus TaxID=1074 RepID=UPI0031BE91A5|nr:D-amino-acid dehydrogenase [Rhodoblastus acidophilus]MCW2331837.1 D-amino-acid dehydrogenase [Rhodoblastus acidophilus]